MEENEITIFCVCDNNFAMYLAVMLKSMVVNHKSSELLHAYIINEGITDKNVKKVEDSVSSDNIKLEWIKAESLDVNNIKGLVLTHFKNYMTYYRLLIQDLLPNTIKKAIYIDCDIVVNKDITDLWHMGFEDNLLFAVPDQFIDKVSKPVYGIINYKELGIPSEAKYFNAGVLLINLDKWRKEKISEKIIKFLKENKKYVNFEDQYGLNAILWNRWKELDPLWNHRPSKDLTEYLCIIHYIKGERADSLRCRQKFRDLFYHYVDMTAWKGFRLSIKYPKTVLVSFKDSSLESLKKNVDWSKIENIQMLKQDISSIQEAGEFGDWIKKEFNKEVEILGAVNKSLSVLYVYAEKDKYPKSFDSLLKLLDGIKGFDITVICLDNLDERKDISKINHPTYNIHDIGGDNSSWEFSAWRKGIKFLEDKSIISDIFLFANDSFLNRAEEGKDINFYKSKINTDALNNLKENEVLGELNRNFLLDTTLLGDNVSSFVRTHLFVAPMSVVNKLSLIYIDDNIINNICPKEFNGKMFNDTELIDKNLKKIFSDWIGHIEFNKKNWNLIRSKIKSMMNERLLTVELRKKNIKIINIWKKKEEDWDIIKTKLIAMSEKKNHLNSSLQN